MKGPIKIHGVEVDNRISSLRVLGGDRDEARSYFSQRKNRR